MAIAAPKNKDSNIKVVVDFKAMFRRMFAGGMQRKYTSEVQLDKTIGCGHNVFNRLLNFAEEIGCRADDLIIVSEHSGSGAIRRRLDPKYKNRTHHADEKAALDKFYKGITQYILEQGHSILIPHVDYEADDLIHALALKYKAEGTELVLFTHDQDLATCGYDMVLKFDETPLESPFELYQVPAEVIKALVGDTSDCFKGVKSIGKKTVGLLSDFYLLDLQKSLESGIVQGLVKTPETKAEQRILDNWESAKHSYELARLRGREIKNYRLFTEEGFTDEILPELP